MNNITTQKEFINWITKKDEKHEKKSYLYNNYRVTEGMLNLNSLRIEKTKISNKHFECTLFKKCVFINCEFDNTVFHSCTFIDCEFILCTFYKSKFLFIELTKTKFSDCTILGLEIADLEANNLVFSDCPEVLDLSLRGFGNRDISFEKCYLHHLDIEPIATNDNHKYENKEEKIDFIKCMIKESSFDRVDFTKSIFKKCSLSLIQFSSCELLTETIDNSNNTPGNEFNMVDIRTILNSAPIDRKVLENIFGINSSDVKEYLIDLTSKIEFQSIFISYSFADKQFAKLINERLNRKGIMTFLWEYDSIGGKTLESIMSTNINEKDRVLFIASKNSLKSKACHYELTEGRKKQEITWNDVLCPIHIDNFIFEVEQSKIRPLEKQEEYWENIVELKKLNSLDFSKFIDLNKRDEHQFEKMLYRLLKGLRK